MRHFFKVSIQLRGYILMHAFAFMDNKVQENNELDIISESYVVKLMFTIVNIKRRNSHVHTLNVFSIEGHYMK